MSKRVPWESGVGQVGAGFVEIAKDSEEPPFLRVPIIPNPKRRFNLHGLNIHQFQYVVNRNINVDY